MIYSIIKIILLVSGAVFVLYHYRKRAKQQKAWIQIAMVLGVAWVLSSSLSWLVYGSVGDHFLAFSTPERAFHFQSSKRIDAVVKGEESALILTVDRAARSWTIVPGSGTSWKLLSYSNNYSIVGKYMDSLHLSLYLLNLEGTDDYFILFAQNLSQGESPVLEVMDSEGSQFGYIAREHQVISYTYLRGLPSDYQILFDGEVFPVEWQELTYPPTIEHDTKKETSKTMNQTKETQ
ncbi:MAG: hypothetical protein FWG24_06460 [Eggerthellaceae bacterium]|nr:hypothetical protein [Eggerthellaceae bacterium]